MKKTHDNHFMNFHDPGFVQYMGDNIHKQLLDNEVLKNFEKTEIFKETKKAIDQKNEYMKQQKSRIIQTTWEKEKFRFAKQNIKAELNMKNCLLGGSKQSKEAINCFIEKTKTDQKYEECRKMADETFYKCWDDYIKPNLESICNQIVQEVQQNQVKQIQLLK